MSAPGPIELGKIYRLRKSGLRVWDDHNPERGRLTMHSELGIPPTLPKNTLVMVVDIRESHHVIQVIVNDHVGWMPISNLKDQWPKYLRQVKG